jgi:bifunctional DNA-binding transcriptional regulator/antitoxin component of YhaV-PrlF toxin-antitoxin module
MVRGMAVQTLQSRLTPEGRALIPAAARAALHAAAGDRLLFVVDGEDVRLISAASLRNQVWANNHSGDAGDAVSDVRAMREHDQHQEESMAVAGEEDARSDEDVTSDLLAALGLPG